MSVNSSTKFNRRAFLGLCLGTLTSFTFGKSSKNELLRGRNLFVYYTRTLNTHILAHYMQGLIGGDLLQIQTQQAYPQDYQSCVALASKQREQGILPPLKPFELDLKGYERVFIAAPLWGMDLCAPIWGMDLCAPMKSFLSSVNLSSKELYLIITNAGYGLGASVKSVKSLAKGAKIAKILDYEKIAPNLRAQNEAKIATNSAFNALDKGKIARFLRS